MSKKIKFLLCLAAAVTLISVRAADAGNPDEVFKGAIDKVISVLKDPALKGQDKLSIRRARIKEIIEPIFNFEEMSKSSLSVHWKNRTDEEKKEFIVLFKNLLENVYANKIEQYTDEEINFLDTKVDGAYGSVKTEIVKKNNVRVPIEYRFVKTNDLWKVYDVVIEGVSLVNNYRPQFNGIINSKSYEDLVKMLKEKQKP